MRDVARESAAPAKIGLLDALLAAFAILGAILVAVFHLVWTPSVAEMLADFGGPIPFTTKLVLLRPFGVFTAALALVAAVAGLAVRLAGAKGIARVLLVLALLTPIAALGLLLHGTYAPIWQLADSIGP